MNSNYINKTRITYVLDIHWRLQLDIFEIVLRIFYLVLRIFYLVELVLFFNIFIGPYWRIFLILLVSNRNIIGTNATDLAASSWAVTWAINWEGLSLKEAELRASYRTESMSCLFSFAEAGTSNWKNITQINKNLNGKKQIRKVKLALNKFSQTFNYIK
jgi:hypothetical protein